MKFEKFFQIKNYPKTPVKSVLNKDEVQIFGGWLINRKTICFSKNEQIHDNVIGMYIEKYCYRSGTYGDCQQI